MDMFEEKKSLLSNTEDATALALEESNVEISEELSEDALDAVAGGGGFVVVVNEQWGGLGWQYGKEED